MSVEFHIKARDAHQMLADAHNEEIEKMAPPSVKYSEKDFDGLKWETKTGGKGEYQQTTKEANQNNEIFQTLQKSLADHKGFAQISGFQYWFHRDDKNTIDRRKK